MTISGQEKPIMRRYNTLFDESNLLPNTIVPFPPAILPFNNRFIKPFGIIKVGPVEILEQHVLPPQD